MFTTVIRTVIVYVLVIFAMRIMGKRQIGDMQPNELVVTLLISEVASIPIQDTSQPILSSIIAIFMLISLELIMAVSTLKSGFMNNIINGQPAILINGGKINQKQLKKMRITIADLVEMLRAQGIFDINEVDFAILETNGNLSVSQKTFYRNMRYGDSFPTKQTNENIPFVVVSDGDIVKRNLNVINKSEDDIIDILRIRKVNLEDVFIMTMDINEKVTLIKKD